MNGLLDPPPFDCAFTPVPEIDCDWETDTFWVVLAVTAVPSHSRLKWLSAAIREMVSLPDVGFSPVQSPNARHWTARFAVQRSVVLPPNGTVSGEAVSAISGAGSGVGVGGGCGCVIEVTVTRVATVADVPMALEQVRVKSVVVVSESEVIEPDDSRVPVQPPDAVQPTEFVETHSSRVDDPAGTLFGVAVSETSGAATAWMLTVPEALPPAPEQVRVKLMEALSGPTD